MASFPETKTIDLADARLPFLEWNSPGETILMLNATGFTPWLWKPVAEALWPGYRIIAPYLCDYRITDPYAGGLDWHRLAYDMKLLLEGLDIKRPLLVGHSMGGAVWVIAEGRFSLQARAMVLVEPILLPREIYQMKITLDQHPLAAKSIKRKNLWSSRKEARSYLKSNRLFRLWDEEVLELYLDYGMVEDDEGVRLACSPRMEAAIFMGGLQYDPWEDLAKIKCPVLVVEGGESTNSQYVDLKKVAAALLQGEHLLIPEAGHLLPMENPAGIAAIIGGFFDLPPAELT